MRLAVLAGVMVIGAGLLVLAESTGHSHEMAPATTRPAASTQPVNTKCPVSGEDIDPKITVNYQGRTIAFCCADCVADFRKNPEKYMKNLK